MHLEEFADGRFEFFHTPKDPAPYAFIRDFREPAFHEIDPGAVCWSKVDVKTGSFGEPVPNQRCFVGAVVIEHDVNVKFGGHIGLDGVQEAAEFLRPMAAVQLANDFSSL